ncbi:MTH1187 family thiamine-binding protein [Gemmatimonadota bacterium]
MLFELSLFPLGKSHGMSKDVSRVIDLIDKSGLPYQLTCMGTMLEGEWDEVIELIDKCRQVLLENNDRIYMLLKGDEQKGKTGRIKGKVDSVEQKLGRPVNK